MSPFFSLHSELFKSHRYHFVGETMWKAAGEKENDRQEPLRALRGDSEGLWPEVLFIL